jgi:hypothetical protein
MILYIITVAEIAVQAKFMGGRHDLNMRFTHIFEMEGG